MVDRRPLGFWNPFNTWWRAELEKTGQRPNTTNIQRCVGAGGATSTTTNSSSTSSLSMQLPVPDRTTASVAAAPIRLPFLALTNKHHASCFCPRTAGMKTSRVMLGALRGPACRRHAHTLSACAPCRQ